MEILIFSLFINQFLQDIERISINAKNSGYGMLKSVGEEFYMASPSSINGTKTSVGFHFTNLFTIYTFSFNRETEKGGFGGGVTLVNIPDFIYTELPDTTLPPGEENRPVPVDTAIFRAFLSQFSIMKKINNFHLGFNLKVSLYSDLKENYASGGGLDAGILYIKDENLKIGTMITNLLSIPSFYTSSHRVEYVLPQIYSGMAKNFSVNNSFNFILISEMGILPFTGSTSPFSFGNVGLEPVVGIGVLYKKVLTLRTAYTFNDLSAGFSASYDRFEISYSLNTEDLNGIRHNLSLEVKFEP